MLAKSSFIKTVLLAAGLVATSSANASLLAHYTFEGNANDVNANGQNATVNGSTLTANDFTRSAYDFDGTNDFLEYGEPKTPTKR